LKHKPPPDWAAAFLGRRACLRSGVFEIPLDFPIGDMDAVIVPFAPFGPGERFVEVGSEYVFQHCVLIQLFQRLGE
jgi:hypothetical protein